MALFFLIGDTALRVKVPPTNNIPLSWVLTKTKHHRMVSVDQIMTRQVFHVDSWFQLIKAWHVKFFQCLWSWSKQSIHEHRDLSKAMVFPTTCLPLGALVLALSCVYEMKISWSLDFRGGNIDISWTLKRTPPNDERYWFWSILDFEKTAHQVTACCFSHFLCSVITLPILW